MKTEELGGGGMTTLRQLSSLSEEMWPHLELKKEYF